MGTSRNVNVQITTLDMQRDAWLPPEYDSNGITARLGGDPLSISYNKSSRNEIVRH
jgi:hypothetical protein